MSFPYIVVDLTNCTVKGIRNEQDAVEQAQCEDVFVIDVKNNEWILSDGDRQEITDEHDEASKEAFSDEAEDEDFPEPDYGEDDSDDIDDSDHNIGN